jgi:uncharacterized protein
MGLVLKILLVVGVVVAVDWVVMGRGRSRVGEPGAQPPSAPRPPAGSPAATPPQEIVTCAHCGLHLPASEALTAGSRRYCSAEHRDADRAV